MKEIAKEKTIGMTKKCAKWLDWIPPSQSSAQI
jgi:hypothetical protein